MPHCCCEAVLLWWLTRGRCILTVSMDAGSTRDMPVRVVHDEGEWEEMDKGDMHGGDVCREPQGGRVGVL